MTRSTPCVDGCCGPMLMIMVSPSPSTSGHGPPVTTRSRVGWQLLGALVGLLGQARVGDEVVLVVRAGIGVVAGAAAVSLISASDLP